MLSCLASGQQVKDVELDGLGVGETIEPGLSSQSPS